ncbi:MAG: hypothetical protein NZ889_02585, partial [Candidatus Pacearchaeota archaeon]|nr:hypothetical protein [Candidatus Pacearchaeota archaeon]
NTLQLNITMKEHNPPVVILQTPENNANFTTPSSNFVSFSLKCYDDSNLSFLQLYGMKITTAGNWSSVWQARETNISPINDSWWNFTLVFSDGIYKIAGRCNDTSNNIGWSENRTFRVDLNAPNIRLNSPPNSYIYNTTSDTQSITLSWTATDAVSSHLLCSLYINNQLKSIQSCASGATCTNTSNFAASGDGIEYRWYVNCSDNFHWNVSETRNFFVKKLSPAGGGGGGGAGGGAIPSQRCGDRVCNALVQEFKFFCNASNFTSLSNISLYGNFDGTWKLVETKTVTGTDASVIFVKSLSSGNYAWNCYVCDFVQGCKFAASNFTINVSIPQDENCFTCPQDCPCPEGHFCDPLLQRCIRKCFCGDAICDASCNETTETCPQDCFFSCGNGVCDIALGENTQNCPQDCAEQQPRQPCGDGICDRAAGENANNCPQDCKAVCGDKICEANETQENCCKDCGCPPGQKCKALEKDDEIVYQCKGVKTWYWLIIIVILALISYFTYKHYKKQLKKKSLRGLGGFFR